MVSIKQLPGKSQIRLIPNRSLSWRQSKLIMGVFACFCLTIAIVWAMVGAWLILPFAGLEVALLLGVTYLVSKSTYQQQIVLINRHHISLQKCQGKHLQDYLFEYDKSRLITFETHHPEDALELYLSDSEHSIRLAEFLNLDDQKTFIQLLGKKGIKLHRIKQSIAFNC